MMIKFSLKQHRLAGICAGGMETVRIVSPLINIHGARLILGMSAIQFRWNVPRGCFPFIWDFGLKSPNDPNENILANGYQGVRFLTRSLLALQRDDAALMPKSWEEAENLIVPKRPVMQNELCVLLDCEESFLIKLKQHGLKVKQMGRSARCEIAPGIVRDFLKLRRVNL
jgi:hypothetical protein